MTSWYLDVLTFYQCSSLCSPYRSYYIKFVKTKDIGSGDKTCELRVWLLSLTNGVVFGLVTYTQRSAMKIA